MSNLTKKLSLMVCQEALHFLTRIGRLILLTNRNMEKVHWWSELSVWKDFKESKTTSSQEEVSHKDETIYTTSQLESTD